MPGEKEKKFANLRAACGFMLGHPGKKLLFMGQEFAQLQEWSEARELDWYLLGEEKHRQMQNYVKKLLHLYQKERALYECDNDPAGFEWVINHMEYDKSMLTFMRKGKKRDTTLVFVCNFSDVAYPKYQMGVPYPGKYKEIFNSDAKKFGGSGVVNARVKASKKEERDERKHSIVINVAPLSVQIFSFTKNETSREGREKAQKGGNNREA